MTHSSTSTAILEDVINNYLEAGWPMLTAMPQGKKSPPLIGNTGHVYFEGRQIALAGYEWQESNNVGLVLATEDSAGFDLLVLDIDDYGDKNGRANLSELEAELGALDLSNLVRSSRRGVEDRGGHYFFKVPKGKAWASGACVGVDILQSGHRYSAVYPSVVDDMQYRWYLGQDETEIPNVDDLPWLPEAWRKHLIKGNAKDPAQKANVANFDTAVTWLKARVMGGEAEPLEVDWGQGSPRHDIMHSKVNQLVCKAVFNGRPGLIATLKKLQQDFTHELKSTGDSTPDRKGEFKKSVVSAVGYAKGQVDVGEVADVNWRELDERVGGVANCAMPDFAQWLGLINPVFEALKKSTKISGLVEAFTVLHPNLLAYTRADNDDKDSNVIVFAESQKKLTRGLLREILSLELAPLFDEESNKIPADADKDSYEYQLKKAIGQYKAALESLVTSSKLDFFEDLLVQKLVRMGKSMPKAKLNTAAHLIGVGNEVLDFELAIENPNGSLKDWLRPREVEDYVTYSVPGDIRKGIAELEDGTKTVSENFLSTALANEEVYEFTQAALGYSIYGSNSHQKVFVFYGHGGGGKTSLFKSMAATLGEDYVSTIKLSQLARAQTDKADPVYRQSLLTRVTFVDETDRGDRLNAGVIKSATESRSGRSLYSNDAVASDSNTVVFMTNNVFHFDHDSGIDRRLAVIPLEADRNAVRDSMGSPQLQWRERDSERAFMLQWLVRGYVKAIDKESILYTENYPKAIDKATSEFVKTADPSQEFFSRLEYTGNEEDFLSSKDMHAEYCKVIGDAFVSSRSFAMKVSAWMKDEGRADTKINTGSVRGYRGWKYNKD